MTIVMQVHVLVSAADGDPERLERTTAALRAELLELDVENVVLMTRGQSPIGSRAGEVAEIGGLLVTATQEAKVLSQVVTVVRGWLARRREEYTAELVIGDDKIVVTGISAATQDRLIDVWLRAHALDRVGED